MCLTKHHAVKTYCGVEIQLHAFLSRQQFEVSGQTHAPAALPGDKGPRYPLDRGLGAVAKIKKIPSLLLPGIEPRPSRPWPSIYTD
jgi:hypothetical protein